LETSFPGEPFKIAVSILYFTGDPSLTLELALVVTTGNRPVAGTSCLKGASNGLLQAGKKGTHFTHYVRFI
jgi:hypothetical protein